MNVLLSQPQSLSSTLNLITALHVAILLICSGYSLKPFYKIQSLLHSISQQVFKRVASRTNCDNNGLRLRGRAAEALVFLI